MKLTKLSKAWIAALVLPLGAGVAGAQQAADTGAAGAAIYKSCRANQQGSQMECACVAGFFGGAMKADEYVIMSIISPFIAKDGSVPDTPGAVAAAQAKKTSMGMTDARFAEVMQRFVEVGGRGAEADKICLSVKDQTN